MHFCIINNPTFPLIFSEFPKSRDLYFTFSGIHVTQALIIPLLSERYLDAVLLQLENILWTNKTIFLKE